MSALARRGGALVLVALTVLAACDRDSTVVESPPSTSTSSPDEPSVGVDPTTVQAGEDVRVTVTGFCASLGVVVTLVPERGAPEVPLLAQGETDAKGRFSARAQVPRDAEVGRHVVEVVHHPMDGREECNPVGGSAPLEVTGSG